MRIMVAGVKRKASDLESILAQILSPMLLFYETQHHLPLRIADCLDRVIRWNEPWLTYCIFCGIIHGNDANAEIL